MGKLIRQVEDLQLSDQDAGHPQFSAYASVKAWLGCLLAALTLLMLSVNEGRAQGQLQWVPGQENPHYTFPVGVPVDQRLPVPNGDCGGTRFTGGGMLPTGLTFEELITGLSDCNSRVYGTPATAGRWVLTYGAHSTATDTIDVTTQVTFTIGGGDATETFRRVQAVARLNSLPGLIGFRTQNDDEEGEEEEESERSSFNFQMSDRGATEMDGSFALDNIWGQFSASRYKTKGAGSTSYKSMAASVGAHRNLSSSALAGFMLHYDKIDASLSADDSIDGKGWLAGPYFAAQHATSPLSFEGRLLYGRSNNDRTMGGTSTSFDTKIWLAQARMEGEFDLESNGIVALPYVDVSWLNDKERETNPRTIELGQLTLGSNFEMPVAAQRGEMTLTGGLGLTLVDDQDASDTFSDPHAQIDIGMDYRVDDSVNVTVNGFYDGIGASGFEGYGLSVGARFDF